jgi:hypothetical protein
MTNEAGVQRKASDLFIVVDLMIEGRFLMRKFFRSGAPLIQNGKCPPLALNCEAVLFNDGIGEHFTRDALHLRLGRFAGDTAV